MEVEMTDKHQPTQSQLEALEALTQESQAMGFYGPCQMLLGIGRCECQENELGGECIYRLQGPKPIKPQVPPESAVSA